MYIIIKKFINKLFVILIGIVTFVSLEISCSKSGENIPQIMDSVSVPFQEFGNTTLYSYDGTVKLWKLEAKYMRKELSDTAYTLTVPVKITQYDSSGKTNSIILADSAHTRDDLDSFYIWGNVYIKTKNDLVIKSESLWWNKSTHKIGSDDYVEITTPAGDILKGKGLDATESFSSWTLRDNVKGWFPNFKERTGSNSKNIAEGE